MGAFNLTAGCWSPPMLTLSTLYLVLDRVLQAAQILGHATARQSVARHLASLLLAQDLRPSARVRILPASMAATARHRFRWLRRALLRSWLASAALTPPLIRAALAVARASGHAPAPGQPWRLALDSVRTGPWEVFTVALVLPGRALPVAWSVLAYPWPRGQFRPVVDALMARVLQSWPRTEPVLLVADRAFPAKSFFRTLARGGAGWAVRVQARHAVTLADGRCVRVAELLEGADPHRVTTHAVTFGAGPDAVRGELVIAGHGLRVVPPHQAGPGSFAARAKRQAKHAQQLAVKYRDRQSTPRDEWLAMFTSEADPRGTLEHYGMRWPIEGTYRDAQGGWDGQQGWNYDLVVVTRATAEEVDVLTGMWAVGTLVQMWVGLGLTDPTAPKTVQRQLRAWSTTGRVSWWLRGRWLLTHPDPVIGDWILRRLTAAQAPLQQAPPVIIPFDPATARRRSPPKAA